MPVRLQRLVAVTATLLLGGTALADKKDKDDDDDKSDAGDKKKFSKKAQAPGDDKKPDDKGSDAKGSDDSSDDDSTPPKKPDDDTKLQKQDLNGHDLGTERKENVFEQGRFFVDKTDSDDKKKGTIIQGSLTSTSFFYTESGGAFQQTGATQPLGDNSSRFSREFTDLRLQTDFRHIGGGRWDFRVDGRVRFVNSIDADNDPLHTVTLEPSHVQSGYAGGNEYELRELWLVRNGEKSDIFFGRQFIPDLGAIKIDGLRVDYASSEKFTYIGFGGLYPQRGSRSIETDYEELKKADGTTAGQYVGTAGFGAAYRTPNAYGSFGGVVLAPLGGGEDPRFYGTATGYYRYGSKLDIYHFAIIDVLGSNAVNNGLTNLSAGLNYKPSQRLRLTANYNRVDTDTLNVQANSYLNQPDTVNTGGNLLSNELFITRLATTSLRGGVSAALGDLNRVEISVAATYRYRPSFLLQILDSPNTETIPLAKSVEVYGSIVDRHSIKDMRLGADVVRTFGVGNVAYQRNELLAVRVFAGKELSSGKGEWEAEIGYSSSDNKTVGGMTNCLAPSLLTGGVNSCFGSSNGTLLQLGGTYYYRLAAAWMGIASVYITHTGIESNDGGVMASDPGITGITGFLRLAYRF